MPIRVLLADDNSSFRQSLRRLLEGRPESAFTVVAEASSGAEAINLTLEFKPDLAVVDVAMEPIGGLEATREIVTLSPGTTVVVLSIHGDRRYVARAIAAGARGYILKDTMDDALHSALLKVANGEQYYSPIHGKRDHRQ